MLGMGLRLLKSGVKMALRSDRSSRALYAFNHLQWLETNRIPSEYLVRLFPDLVGGETLVSTDISHPFELPYGERLILAALVSVVMPKIVFEFGTFTGTTTKLLADAVPEAQVHTLDLPSEEMKWERWIADVIGAAFKSDASYDGRIVQHRSNSRQFQFGPLKNKVDLVFVDASHEYEDVLHDSEKALEIVSSSGLVVWDDYQPSIPGVVEALNRIQDQGIQLARIAESRLVIHSSEGFAVELEPLNTQPWSLAPNHGSPNVSETGSIYQ